MLSPGKVVSYCNDLSVLLSCDLAYATDAVSLLGWDKCAQAGRRAGTSHWDAPLHWKVEAVLRGWGSRETVTPFPCSNPKRAEHTGDVLAGSRTAAEMSP